jgi:hypothetical protein
VREGRLSDPRPVSSSTPTTVPCTLTPCLSSARVRSCRGRTTPRSVTPAATRIRPRVVGASESKTPESSRTTAPSETARPTPARPRNDTSTGCHPCRRRWRCCSGVWAVHLWRTRSIPPSPRRPIGPTLSAGRSDPFAEDGRARGLRDPNLTVRTGSAAEGQTTDKSGHERSRAASETAGRSAHGLPTWGGGVRPHARTWAALGPRTTQHQRSAADNHGQQHCRSTRPSAGSATTWTPLATTRVTGSSLSRPPLEPAGQPSGSNTWRSSISTSAPYSPG